MLHETAPGLRALGDTGDTMDNEQRQSDMPRHIDQQAHHGIESTPVKARQGVISGRVILVLLTSLLLTVIAFVVGYFAVH